MIASSTGVCLPRFTNAVPVTDAPIKALPPYPAGGFKQDVPDTSGFDWAAEQAKFSNPAMVAQQLPELKVFGKAWFIPVALFVLVLVAAKAAHR